MTLSLPRDLEEFVSKEVEAGGYPDATALVVEALREFQIKTAEETPLNEGCPPDLKALLLEAVNGQHHPMPDDYFEQLRMRLRAPRSQ
jgi:Arc/MetJ-type ribon-helix-helix transcriptional regulator